MFREFAVAQRSHAVNSVAPSSERSSAWLEHLLWEQDVAGSNPVAPTTSFLIAGEKHPRNPKGKSERGAALEPAIFLPPQHGKVRWGDDTSRLDFSVGYRITTHAQLKLQYSLLHAEQRDHCSDLLAAQFTVRF
jgi:hypothetical protein